MLTVENKYRRPCFMIRAYLFRSSRDRTRTEDSRWFSSWRCREKMSLNVRHSSRRINDRRSDEEKNGNFYPWHTIVEIIIEKDGPRFIFCAHAQSLFFVPSCILNIRCNSNYRRQITNFFKITVVSQLKNEFWTIKCEKLKFKSRN